MYLFIFCSLVLEDLNSVVHVLSVHLLSVQIYRSYVVKEYSSSLEQTLEGNGTTSEMDPVLQQFFYLAFVPRSLAAVSALQLTRFNQDSTALSGIIKNIR